MWIQDMSDLSDSNNQHVNLKLVDKDLASSCPIIPIDKGTFKIGW